MIRILKTLICLLLILSFGTSAVLPAAAAEKTENAVILFTHDLHSHLLPAQDENGGEYGGYARLMTAIREQRTAHPNALLVDAGDFSMGSLFQTAYTTSALELRIMGAMGYDVTTFGNHEFDYLPKGLAGMLNAAASCGELVPAIVDANYWPPEEGQEGWNEDAQLVRQAMENFGVKDYVILERGGVYFALFGLTGQDSNKCAPNSGMVLQDPATAAQAVVDRAVAECKSKYGVEPLVIALSHSGTQDGKGEDYELAKNVKGIDLIVSGHSHTTLPQPIQVGQTYIVSAGEYSKNLGRIELEQKADGSVSLADFALIPINESVASDPEIEAMVESFQKNVEENYLADYGMTFHQVLVNNPYEFEKPEALYNYAHESTLGNVFSDAYRWAAEKALGHPVDLALTASGVVRETIPQGNVTVSDIFNAASLGVGTEGELVCAWLTGADLKCALEGDASVYPLMHAAQLFCSGAEYSFNTNRMIFNKVDYAMLRRPDGTLEAIQDDKLYCVVVGMYMAQMLGSVRDLSKGMLSTVPRDAQGNPMGDQELLESVIRDENGVPVKEWYAIASYLQQMGGEMDAQYAQTDGRKVVYSSWNPADLLRNANVFTRIAMAAVLLLILLAGLVVRLICKKKRKNRK